ncbi:unnamed protein product, partial [Didymodactylos carnosus]
MSLRKTPSMDQFCGSYEADSGIFGGGGLSYDEATDNDPRGTGDETPFEELEQEEPAVTTRPPPIINISVILNHSPKLKTTPEPHYYYEEDFHYYQS